MNQELLKTVCHYDPETGVFKRVMKMSNKSRRLFPCESTPTAESRGYLQIGIAGKVYSVHRLIWVYMRGEFPKGEVDHIDGDRRNNKFENLRVVEHCVNSRNIGVGAANKSGAIGVSCESEYGTYKAYITKDGVRTHIGSFKTKAAALSARKHYEQILDFHENHGGRSLW